MTAPAADIITHLIDYSGHKPDCYKMRTDTDADFCQCGYSAAIADALDFLEEESDGE